MELLRACQAAVCCVAVLDELLLRALRSGAAAGDLPPTSDAEDVRLGWVQRRDAEREAIAAFDRGAGGLDRALGVAAVHAPGPLESRLARTALGTRALRAPRRQPAATG